MQETAVVTGVLSLLFGIIAGLRAMTAPAAVSWAAATGRLNVDDTWLAFFGATVTPWIFTLAAIGELVNDKRPTTPSRTVPVQFAARIISGGLSGAAIGASSGAPVVGAIAGMAGAVLGTLGGRAVRGRLASAFGKDRPAALIEDAIAVGSAIFLVVSRL